MRVLAVRGLPTLLRNRQTPVPDGEGVAPVPALRGYRKTGEGRPARLRGSERPLSARELHNWAGLDRPEIADPLASLLDLLSEHLATMDAQSRQHVVSVAYDCVGQPMQQSMSRRTRKR